MTFDRDQTIETAAQVIRLHTSAQMNYQPSPRVAAAAVLSVIVRAITDVIRRQHRPSHQARSVVGDVLCRECYKAHPCPTRQLADYLDQQAGVQR
ncbi:MAG: hypothetical protein KIT69_07380 [Propionibacteriaceae bacterium]|nr:hypothetical protein [Propionibacteriaceae bacterium]